VPEMPGGRQSRSPTSCADCKPQSYRCTNALVRLERFGLENFLLRWPYISSHWISEPVWESDMYYYVD
jgi:hypothetical protein